MTSHKYRIVHDKAKHPSDAFYVERRDFWGIFFYGGNGWLYQTGTSASSAEEAEEKLFENLRKNKAIVKTFEVVGK